MSDLDPVARKELVKRYAEGPQAIAEALAGATDAELDRIPEPGEWSARQVLHHVADAETMSATRLRRLLAEDEPLIFSYDENEFARVLHYDRPIAADLDVIFAVRAASAELLEGLSDEEWDRRGVHSEDGAYGVERWLQIYAAHARDHADQIRRARGGG